MLVTLGDLEDRRRYLNASATLERLLELGAPTSGPIVQAVSRELVKVGADDKKKKNAEDDASAESVAPMHIAAQAGHVACLQALLDSGAEVDVLTSPRKLTPQTASPATAWRSCRGRRTLITR